MTKNILLAAAAVSAMAFAGAASAHTVTFRAPATASATDIDSVDVGGVNGTYKLALEAAAVAPTSAVFALTDTLTGGSSLPSGNVLLTLTLTGGTWGPGGVTAAAITADTAGACPTFTATPSSGGAAGTTTATFLISNSSAGCSSFFMDLPVAPGSGAVSVTSTLKTEANTPIDGLDAVKALVTRPSAFNAVFDATVSASGTTGGALGDTFATLTVVPVYTTFKTGASAHTTAPESATVGQLGTVALLVDTSAFKDMAKTPVALGDVTAPVLTTTGNFSAFDGVGGGVTLGGVAPTSLTGTTAVHSGAAVLANLIEVGAAGATPVSPEAFVVTRETTAVAIPTSTYTTSLAYTLASPTYNAEGPFPGNFETIGRDGTNVVIPWLNSTSVQASNGTSNIIRLGNTGTAVTGPVYATVLNSSLTAGVATTAQPLNGGVGIPVKGELIITTASLTAALGEFGRGDVLISVEAPASTVTARRYATLANGSTTEVSNGTVASDQTGDSTNNGGVDVP